MPIEIRELHIRVAVNTTQGSEAAGGKLATNSDEGSDEAQKALVAECVEQVLRVLQNKTER